MDLNDYVEYQRREFCNDLPCPIQTLLNEAEGTPRVAVRGIASLDLFVRPGATRKQREAVLDRWYREQLKALLAPMFTAWQAKLGVQASAWGVKRMKTKWGSCTPASRRVWLNSELAKKPVECIEYIVVHELLHLAEPNHGERFVALMNRYLPRWGATQERLNAAPLGHEEWGADDAGARRAPHDGT